MQKTLLLAEKLNFDQVTSGIFPDSAASEVREDCVHAAAELIFTGLATRDHRKLVV